MDQADFIDFFKHVQSYLNKGKRFEVDRKVGNLLEYKKIEDTDKNTLNDLIEKIKSALESIENFNKYLDWLKNYSSVGDEAEELVEEYEKEILYLPAPYNEKNCVLACHWCNNAKTDAFTADEFKPIGKEIGATIQMILKKYKPKGV